ncbi:helix-turn-helix transcriptional regulator [Mycobacterium sp. NAZ190054]|uniref:helix-turn-helix transcriptional regulator n=1 Tax=Mycobacterium sp. NAZ190054 TaxID=1747766 RepID=UPI00079A351F|nr:helix-turn-helix transcriptional regulator [Mycobacterium sp. NAZ190054]KWX67631.1 XRE family transcriptional regulator [Mycobacterium sp. NAZ190054]
MKTAFGQLVRQWRDRLSPDDVGLPVTSKRRAPGLRREELASLAGLSVDYVVRLEHGRARRPSAQVVTALSRALQLSRQERDQLFVSAGLMPPRDGTVGTHIPAGVARLISRIGDVPVGVFAADWTLLTWNAAWAALLGEPARLPVGERNLARAIFGTGPAHDALRQSRSQNTDEFEKSIVADLRHAVTHYPNDARLGALVQDLRATSPRFARWWDDSAPAPHTSARKTIVHPAVGEITLDCDVLSVPAADLRIVTFTAAVGSEDESKLSLVRVTNGDNMTADKDPRRV